MLVLEGRLNAHTLDGKCHRENTIAHIKQLHQRADKQDQRIQALEQRIEQIGQRCLDDLQQLAASIGGTDARIAALREELDKQKHEAHNLNSNLLATFGHLSQVDAVMFVLSEQSRKIDEKLRACEHQRLKAEAVLRSMASNAATPHGYNALVEAGMQRIPELQQRVSQNKKDLLIGMASRLKHDYNIDVIDENTGQMKTTLFPRPIHHHHPQPQPQPQPQPPPALAPSPRNLSANERAAALAAKAEADELRIMEGRREQH